MMRNPVSYIFLLILLILSNPTPVWAAECVALTFDDGPHPKLTPLLLDILKNEGVPATFFVLGRSAARWPEILVRMRQEGHEIGNHSWDHPDLTKLGAAELQRQIARTDAAIVNAVGERPVFVRPPYGAANQAVAKAAGRPLILWDSDTLDWRYRTEVSIVNRARSGGIVLMHDIHKSTVRSATAVIRMFKQRGSRFVTLSRFFDSNCR